MDMQPTPEKERKSIYQTLISFHHYWLIAAFLFSFFHIFLLQQLDFGAVLLFLLPPICALLHLNSSKATRVSKIYVLLFFLCVGIGIDLSFWQNVFPKINFFPRIPLIESRILSFYTITYILFAFVLVPPYLFGKPLLQKWAGERPYFHPITCYLGFFAWGLLMLAFSIAIPPLVHKFL